MTVLGIDTSSKTASCAVIKDGLLLCETTVYTKLTHSQVILPFVIRMLGDAGVELSDIDLVAVANGPGSYTGLRIGIALVKGLCYDGKKCIGVSTLEALAYGCVSAKARIFSVMRARQGVVYFGAYDSDGSCLKCALPDGVVSDEQIYKCAGEWDGDIILVGDCAEQIKHELFADDERVRLAPTAVMLGNAASLCMAAVAHAGEASDAKALNAKYLQITKAEKDRLEKKI